MKNILILVVFFLMLAISAFLISCDDFLAPTIEIFNEITIEQKQEKKEQIIN
jgi:lipopolysaccharide export LptBFGC system permease protein LptF